MWKWLVCLDISAVVISLFKNIFTHTACDCSLHIHLHLLGLINGTKSRFCSMGRSWINELPQDLYISEIVSFDLIVYKSSFFNPQWLSWIGYKRGTSLKYTAEKCHCVLPTGALSSLCLIFDPNSKHLAMCHIFVMWYLLLYWHLQIKQEHFFAKTPVVCATQPPWLGGLEIWHL